MRELINNNNSNNNNNEGNEVDVSICWWQQGERVKSDGGKVDAKRLSVCCCETAAVNKRRLDTHNGELELQQRVNEGGGGVVRVDEGGMEGWGKGARESERKRTKERKRTRERDERGQRRSVVEDIKRYPHSMNICIYWG
jgi:hypothetical protein